MKKQRTGYYVTSTAGASRTKEFYTDAQAWESLRKPINKKGVLMALWKETRIPINDSEHYTKEYGEWRTLYFIPIAVGLASHKWTLT